MVKTLMGLSVTREIPAEVVIGLMTGQYKQHGGVIRWAANSEQAGQIVRHLLPIAREVGGASLFAPLSGALGTINTYQLHKLTGQVGALAETTKQVLQIATGTMLLSGLNLAVTSVGFAVLNKKLNNLECKLNEIQKEVKAIRSLLELEERSRLASSLRDLLTIDNVKNIDHRQTLLFNSKNILAPISLKYKELLAGANSLEIAMAYEEYFCLTSLAHARCLAELGMLEMACQDLEETKVFWHSQARRVANDFILGDNPERFLCSDFSKEIPVPVVAEWLDFAYGEEKGFGWIDELRSKSQPWQPENNWSGIKRGGEMIVSNVKNIIANLPRGKKVEDKERSTIIPSLQKLVARNNVLDGFISQYAFLEKNNIAPTEFDRQVSLLAQTEAVDGIIILQPAQLAA